MKKVLLSIFALVQIIAGMLIIFSSISYNTFADVKFDSDQSNAWYGKGNPDAIINVRGDVLPPAVSVEIINRTSH